MRVKLRYLSLFFVLMCLFGVIGCAFFEGMGGPQSQAAKKAFETRMVDAKYNDVYAAAIESMFDLGYTVSHTDKATGIVVGEKNQKRYVNTSGMTAEEKRREGPKTNMIRFN